jgi:hypothetical protein
MGGPLANTNSVRHGARVIRLTVGNLPPKLQRVQRYIRGYRETLEEAVVRARGSVGDMQAHWIDAACEHEKHRQVLRWLLRQKLDDPKFDVARNMDAQAEAADKRNRAVERLGLDRPPENPWDAIDVPSNGADGDE